MITLTSFQMIIIYDYHAIHLETKQRRVNISIGYRSTDVLEIIGLMMWVMGRNIITRWWQRRWLNKRSLSAPLATVDDDVNSPRAGRSCGSAGVSGTRARMFIIAGCIKCANGERSLDKHNWNIYPNKRAASPQARKGPQLSLITSHSSRSGTVHHDPRRIMFFMGHHASVRCPILWRNYLAKQSSRAVTSADIKLILQFCNKMKLRTGRLVHDLYSAAVRALRWPGRRSREAVLSAAW